MRGNRKYERFDINHTGGDTAQVGCLVEEMPVRLVDYSLGGIFFFQKNLSLRVKQLRYLLTWRIGA
jgi:hypothetical protein